jgi:hypothetical protein
MCYNLASIANFLSFISSDFTLFKARPGVILVICIELLYQVKLVTILNYEIIVSLHGCSHLGLFRLHGD